MNFKDKKTHIPWVTDKAKDWLDSYLKNSMVTFEWGSGGSTLYLCDRVKRVVSIEHNEEWYKKVDSIIKNNNINNCKYVLKKPQKLNLLKHLPYSKFLFNSTTFKEYLGYSFRSYVKQIDKYPNKYFDVVFVDGRSRIACIRHAIKKIKNGGILILDNSEREAYQSAFKNLAKYKHKNYFGNGPYSDIKWQTTVWFINDTKSDNLL